MSRTIDASPRFDPARFFTTDPADGALLDRNGDGIPDGLRVRLVIDGEPTAPEWVELVHLAARLGLETGGLAFPLAPAARDPAALPPDTLALVFRPEGGETPLRTARGGADAAGLVIHGAAGLRALWRQGLAEGTVDDGEVGDRAAPGAASSEPPSGPLDLAALYESDGRGLLADDDGDLFADRVRVCPLVPPRLPGEVGRALLDFAARLGLESAGLRFPIAVPLGAPRPAGTLPLLIALAPDPPPELPDEALAGLPSLAPGEGLCAAVTTRAGEPALLVRGDAAGAARTLRALAEGWPHPRGWDPAGADAGDIAAALVALLRGEDATGRAAILAADLAALARAPGPEVAAGAELRLLDDDPQLHREARAAVARVGLPLSVISAPGDRLVSLDEAAEWRDEWEVERARRAVRERVLPTIDPARPVELLVMVSEPPAPRRALAEDLVEMLPAGSSVRVLSAFKPGLCWVREVVAPAWVARGDVARVEVRYRPFAPPAAPEGIGALDLPIRWLQELYPGDEILAGALGLPTEAVTMVEEAGSAPTGDTYRAVAFGADGRELDALAFSPRCYTRPYLDGAPEAGLVTVTTGAIIARDRRGGRVLVDDALPTDLDRFWAHYQGEVLPRLRRFIEAETGGVASAAAQPFFAALDVEVWCSEPDEPLGIREELLSSAEALHEDIYFATLDDVAALGGRPGSSGTLSGTATGEVPVLDAPGAIRPFIHVREGAPRARIALRRRLRGLADLVVATGGEEWRAPLGVLPTGPRPRVAVRWALAGTGAAGFSRLGLTIADPPERAAAILRQAGEGAGRCSPGGETIALSVALAGQEGPIDLALPLPTAGRRDAAPAGVAPPPFPAAPIGEAELRPALARLVALPGVFVRRAGRSFEGRVIDAIEVVAPPGEGVWSRHKASLFKPTLLVAAGHHANEVASTPAALRLAELCATDPAYRPLLDRVNLVLIPFENPDGAALHHALQREHPTWKLHAARYNAAGCEFARDFFNPETLWGEARVRPALWRRWLPDVVVDNHGVPSHEWNQLFNGFGSPPRFGVSYWLVPALLYGILRYPEDDPARRAFAETVRERIAAAVAAEPALLAANRRLRERYDTWGHARLPERFPAAYHREMLWYFAPLPPDWRERSRQPDAYYRVTAVNLVTEVADETAQGDYLALVAHGHLVANRALLQLLAEGAPRAPHPPVGSGRARRRSAATPDGLWVTLRRSNIAADLPA